MMIGNKRARDDDESTANEQNQGTYLLTNRISMSLRT